ncbi:unnamed protein product [Nippostrongylus brasiliensis]|uniref:Uncharacterized protein n=1 Tax=Nippostrongylus brasiliensis TaxID=27835 RepID=A0A0N4XU34_NIPBR|nr:unnamed protein product [Nippostrongylus brasiliensis]
MKQKIEKKNREKESEQACTTHYTTTAPVGHSANPSAEKPLQLDEFMAQTFTCSHPPTAGRMFARNGENALQRTNTVCDHYLKHAIPVRVHRLKVTHFSSAFKPRLQ